MHMDRRWKVGALAEASGVTVRALHHFDEIGLLRPSERSSAGHRLYTEDDVRRLYRIVALRQLGIPLREIAASLDGGAADLGAVVRRQLGHVEDTVERQQRVRRGLHALLRDAGRGGTRPIDQLITTMEAVMNASDFTDEQLTRAAERHAEPGFVERFGAWQARCAELADEFRAHLAQGTDPADPAVQALAGQWNEAMAAMVEGDRGLMSAMYAKIDGQGPAAATRGILDAEVWRYLQLAFATGYGRPIAPEGTEEE